MSCKRNHREGGSSASAASSDAWHSILTDLARQGLLTHDRVHDALVAQPREPYLLAVPTLNSRQSLADVHAHKRTTLGPHADTPIQIGSGSTISAPHMVTIMLHAAGPPSPGDSILELGSGSGWVLALLAELVGPTGQVTGIEIEQHLCQAATTALRARGYRVHHESSEPNIDALDAQQPQAAGRSPAPVVPGASGVIRIIQGSLENDAGVLGLECWDAILYSYGVRTTPTNALQALRPGGVLLAPVGPSNDQVLHRWRRPSSNAPGSDPTSHDSTPDRAPARVVTPSHSTGARRTAAADTALDPPGWVHDQLGRVRFVLDKRPP